MRKNNLTQLIPITLLTLLTSACQSLSLFSSSPEFSAEQAKATTEVSEVVPEIVPEIVIDLVSENGLKTEDPNSPIQTGNGDTVTQAEKELSSSITYTTHIQQDIDNVIDNNEGISVENSEDLSAIVNDILEIAEKESNLISYVQDNLKLDIPENKRLASQFNWYARHPSYLNRTFNRAQPFLYMIVKEVEKRKLPLELALLPIVESAFDPFAYSHGRASGIWQFIPGTGKRYGLKQNWWYDGRRDVYAATHSALDYLTDLNKRFDGDWLLALASYNSGEGNVARAIRRNRLKNKPTDFWSLKLPKETEAYVPKLLALAKLIKHADKYQLELPVIANEPFLKKIETQSQLDLALAADLAELSMDEIYGYNAAFNRWATDPDGPHYLLIPVGKAEHFTQQLEQLVPEKRIKWERYSVRTGDSVGKIARKFNTTKELIVSVNQLNSNLIKIGQKLMIPTATRNLDQYSLSANSRLNKIKSRKHQGNKLEYRVKNGDSLWKISRNFKVNVRSLAKWNGMAPRDKLSVGKKLVVWTKQKTLVNPISTGPSTTRKIHYKVRNGDSIARISQKFKVGMKDLLKWNRIDPKKYLKPGQSITLFVDVTRQSGI